MSRDDAYLLDILIAARRVVAFSNDLTWEGFQKSDVHQHAIMRLLEIIGEAARRISEKTKMGRPEIPWGDMIGMRNKLIHDYFRIDMAKVWDTVKSDIPPLIALIEPLVPPEQSDTST